MDAVEQYVHALPEERKEVLSKLLEIIQEHLPDGFQECIMYNMPGWVVPHSTYPKGYHVDSSSPLPFLNVASQKKPHCVVSYGGVFRSVVACVG